MYEIGKTFRFAAAHSLPSLPESHKCHRVHGHNYQVDVVLRSDKLDGHGMVLDYGIIGGSLGVTIKAVLDHRDLNDVLDVEPTAENLARWLHNLIIRVEPWAGMLHAVTVRETGGTWATFYA